MAEENDDKAVAFEDMELESGDTMTNDKPSATEATDNSIYQSKVESGIVDVEEADKLTDGTSDASTKEEDEDSRGNITERVLVEKFPTEDTDLSVGHLRKKSDIVLVGPNHKFVVRSRYRSASMGSCHDLCKNGHKHEPEKKIKRLITRTNREAQPLMKTTSEDLGKRVPEKVAKKKENNRRISLSGPLPENSPLMRMDNSFRKKDINQLKMKHTVPSPGNSSSSKIETRAFRRTLTESSNSQNSSTQKVKDIKKLKEVGSFSKGEKEVKLKELVCSSPETSVKDADHSKGEKRIKVKDLMSNSPKTPLKKSPSFKARLYKNSRSSSRSKKQINPEEPEIDGHDDDIPKKILGMIEPSTRMKPAEKTSNIILPGKTQGSKGNRKGNGFSLLSSSSRLSSRNQGEDQQGSEAATKNKEFGVKTEDGGSKTRTARAKSAVSRRMKNLEFKHTKQSDTIREDGWSKTNNASRAKSTVDPKLKAIRKDKSRLEEKDASAWKVKFKRGTVVALQTTNNAPKKLRFKRAKYLGEDENGKSDADRKSKNENDVGNETHDAELGPEKVRLRHQEASEKKDDVDLNNVIEETASKLVKTRKSKVKALVGAFETVMSLRDRKHLVEPSAS
ncbi:hypothetical protein SOVF_159760 [Spinacia oleracea]|uniref:Calmodulin-binding domain-containing protein n=1 Tax=Spinacia oleracea TaxID=3562 RepID=A0A9R0K820_SPIOL|nr:uncharacterized protein LOC110799899 [Spinacia oleracea]KNA08761.1 hypothetical protein SOVF_159760 [Spinacia oleracea]